MTKKEKREIYWQLYFCMEGMKYMPISQRHGVTITLLILSEKFPVSLYFDELYSQIGLYAGQPNDLSGIDKRLKAILKAIELTY